MSEQDEQGGEFQADRKDAAYLAGHPEEIPFSDANALESLIQSMGEAEDGALSSGTSADEETIEPEAAQTDVKLEPASSGRAGEGATSSEDPANGANPEGGDRVVPLAALQSERRKRQEAQEMLKALLEKQNELEARLAAQSSVLSANAPSESAPPAPVSFDEAKLKALSDSFPEMSDLARHVLALQKELSTVRGVAENVSAREAARLADEAVAAARQAETARDAVRSAVDGNPMLLYWEGHDPERWNLAMMADRSLSELPMADAMPMKDRLEKVVRIVEVLSGKTDLPGAYRAVDAPGGPSAGEKPPPPALPRTLSDLPGGSMAATNPLDEIGRMRGDELALKVSDMTDDQIGALLARV